MKTKHTAAKLLCRITALLLVLATALGLTRPVLAGDSSRIHISSAEDLLELAENCTLDTWSQGKTVILDRDISLTGTDFSPIATFGGTFDGGGHTISGLSIESSVSPAGLFSTLQEGAVVKNLHVSGYVSPSGDRSQVGGIAGSSAGSILDCSFSGIVQGQTDVGGIVGSSSGRVLRCTSEGDISGESHTGGIAGTNSGTIIRCSNDSDINTVSVDPSMNLEDITVDITLDLEDRNTLDNLNTASDTGGIAGYSTGSISGCENTATIGYPHVGYNVGGIAGRSCGYLYNCENSGEIYGRKDVGGIIGQAEPYVITNLSESTLAKLESQLDALSGLTNQALDDTEEGSDVISARLEKITEYISSAASAVGNIRTTIYMSASVSGSGSASGGGDASVTPPSVDVDGEGSYDNSTEIDVTPPELPSGIQETAASAPEYSLTTLQNTAQSYQVLPLDVSIESSGGADGSVDVSGTPGEAEVSGYGEASGEAYASGSATANTNLSGVSAAMNGIAGQLQLLGDETSGMSSTLLADMRAISQQFDAISDTLFEAVDEFAGGGDSDTVSDTSAENINAVTFGKAKDCSNSGAIYGDLNVGGIAGAMSVEYEFDPEDDVSEHLSARYKREYELKAILQSCVNRGQVVSKKDCAGGLCGRMDLGLVYCGENYGGVESESGDYVGGIAGLTNSTIWQCYVKCALSGGSYIGGIVGSGVTDSVTGSSSLVAQCYSMVDISEAQQFAGAISGCDAGAFWENYFVSDSLAGIDRLSRTGMAEPLSYKALLQVEDLPREFQHFTLTFVADDVVLDTVEFSYGDSFEESVYPEIPEKEGCYADWDRQELDELHMDTVVTAQYTQYVTTLASQAQQEDARTTFYLEGQFANGDSLSAQAEPVNTAEFVGISIDFWEAVKDYCSFLRRGKWPSGSINRSVEEQWSLHIPEDGLDSHTVRYHPIDGNVENRTVYVRKASGWSRVSTEAVGSYLTFDVEGTEAEIAVVSTLPVWWVWLIVLGVDVLILLLMIGLIRKIRKKRKAKKARQAVPAPPMDEDAIMAARVKAAEEMLARAEQELAALRSARNSATAAASETSAAAPAEAPVPVAAGMPEAAPTPEEQPAAAPAEPAEPAAPAPAAPKARKKWIVPLVVAICALAIVAALLCFLGSGIQEGYDVLRLLRDLEARKDVETELSVELEAGTSSMELSALMYQTDVDGTPVLCVTQNGIALYYAEDTVYLENGSAYQAADLVADYTVLASHLLEIYKATDISRTSSGDTDLYTVTASEEDAETLFSLLCPAAAQFTAADDMEICVEAREGAITSIRISGTGTLAGDVEAAVDAALIVGSDTVEHTVPEAVASALSSGEQPEELTLTDDTVRLLSACKDLCQQELFAGTAQVTVSCGPLAVNDSLQLYRATAASTPIGCVQRDGLCLYFSGGSVCDAEGKLLSASEETAVDYTQLLEIAYALCQNATASCTEAGGIYTYTVELTGDALAQAAYTIAPEAQELDVTLETGTLQITVEDGAVTALGFTCDGSIRIIAVDAAAKIACDITCEEPPEDTEDILPEKVIKALTT